MIKKFCINFLKNRKFVAFLEREMTEREERRLARFDPLGLKLKKIMLRGGEFAKFFQIIILR